jgi:hypothetical protein
MHNTPHSMQILDGLVLSRQEFAQKGQQLGAQCDQRGVHQLRELVAIDDAAALRVKLLEDGSQQCVRLRAQRAHGGAAIALAVVYFAKQRHLGKAAAWRREREDKNEYKNEK